MGPDFSSVDSLHKAEQLVAQGQLERMLFTPAEFGGLDTPENVTYVPIGTTASKAGFEQNIVLPLVQERKGMMYTAVPEYEGTSFVPVAVHLSVWDPESPDTGSVTAVLPLWGTALQRAMQAMTSEQDGVDVRGGLDRLGTLIAPPETPTPRYWERTETALGVTLPADFKELVDTYGDTAWCRVLRLLYPTTDRPGLDLAGYTEMRREFLFLDPDEAQELFSPLGVREPGEFICWGFGGSGEYYLWHCVDPDPGRWPVVLVDRDKTQTYVYPGPVTAFLYDWITRAIAPPDLSADFDRDARLDGANPSVTFYPDGTDESIEVELPEMPAE